LTLPARLCWPKAEPEIPNKFGGVSGGGLWHFDVARYPTVGLNRHAFTCLALRSTSYQNQSLVL
jgi:hypothetical protein